MHKGDRRSVTSTEWAASLMNQILQVHGGDSTGLPPFLNGLNAHKIHNHPTSARYGQESHPVVNWETEEVILDASVLPSIPQDFQASASSYSLLSKHVAGYKEFIWTKNACSAFNKGAFLGIYAQYPGHEHMGQVIDMLLKDTVQGEGISIVKLEGEYLSTITLGSVKRSSIPEYFSPEEQEKAYRLFDKYAPKQ